MRAAALCHDGSRDARCCWSVLRRATPPNGPSPLTFDGNRFGYRQNRFGHVECGANPRSTPPPSKSQLDLKPTIPAQERRLPSGCFSKSRPALLEPASPLAAPRRPPSDSSPGLAIPGSVTARLGSARFGSGPARSSARLRIRFGEPGTVTGSGPDPRLPAPAPPPIRVPAPSSSLLAPAPGSAPARPRPRLGSVPARLGPGSAPPRLGSAPARPRPRLGPGSARPPTRPRPPPCP
jgi:hypothetical protein